MRISDWSSDVCSSDLPEAPRAAMRVAIETARNAGRKVAFTLSDGFCVDRHRNDFRTLIESGATDILFATEDEACSLTKTDSVDSATDCLDGRAEGVDNRRSAKSEVALTGWTGP